MGGIQTHNLQPHLSPVPHNCILTMLVMYLRWKKWTENQGKSLRKEFLRKCGNSGRKEGWNCQDELPVSTQHASHSRGPGNATFPVVCPDGEASRRSRCRPDRVPPHGDARHGRRYHQKNSPKKRQKKNACAHLRARVCVCVPLCCWWLCFRIVSKPPRNKCARASGPKEIYHKQEGRQSARGWSGGVRMEQERGERQRGKKE